MSHSLLQLDKVKTDFFFLSFTPRFATLIVFSISIKYPSIHPLAELRSHPSEILLKNIYYPNLLSVTKITAVVSAGLSIFTITFNLIHFLYTNHICNFLLKVLQWLILKSKHDFPAGPTSHSPAVIHQAPAMLASSLFKHAFRHLYLLFAPEFYMFGSCLSFRS